MLNDRRWIDTKRVVWQRADGLCEWCRRDGKITAGVDCHHIIPFESATTQAEMKRLCYSVDNCVLLCVPHHQRAHKEMMSKTKAKVKERREQRFARWVDKMSGSPMSGDRPLADGCQGSVPDDIAGSAEGEPTDDIERSPR